MFVENIFSKESLLITGFVSAQSGVVLRTSPTTKSEKVLIIPKNSKVEIIKFSDNIDCIDNIYSKWMEVYYSGKKGWVFGGFVIISTSNDNSSQEKINQFCRSPFLKVDYIKNVSNNMVSDLTNIFGKKYTIEKIKGINKYDPKIASESIIIKYSNFQFEIFSGNKQILKKVIISGNQEELRYGIKIGDKLETLYNVLGIPNQSSNGMVSYFEKGDSLKTIRFIISNFKIDKIELEISLD